jgi:NAD(P)-binding Rossmann-like domain
MNVDAPICIIGAGVSGILAAERLHRLGYHRVDIIEARAQPGGYAESIEVDGKVYDFQAHLLAQQDFGKDMAGTAVQELLDRYPMEVHAEALHFVSRSRSGKVRMSLPPNFVPLFKSLQPEQVIEQLFQAWSLIERAARDRTGPGLQGLSFDRIPGETWETFRARHPPLVGEILQSMTLYANMRRLGQPAETVIGSNACLSGNVSQIAKAVLAVYPDHRESMLARMPASLRAQIGSERPIALSLPSGFNSFMQKIVRDCRLSIMLDTRVVLVDAGSRGAVDVMLRRGPDGELFCKTYERVLVTSKPRETREMFADADIRELFSEPNCPTTWTRSYLVKAREEALPFPQSASAGESLGFWLIDPYASYTDTDPAQSLHRITAANKQHESPYWVCFSNSDRSISDEEAWKLARDSLFLFPEPELITERIANWPVYPSAAALRNGWFERLEAIQGRGGVHFIGELLSGPTIEAISTYLRDVIPRWFAAPEAAATAPRPA